MPDTEALLQDWKAKTDAATPGERYARGKVWGDYEVMALAHWPKLLAAVAAIRALHGEMRYHNPDGSVTPACSVCDSQPYPCETLQALDDALSGSEPDERGGK